MNFEWIYIVEQQISRTGKWKKFWEGKSETEAIESFTALMGQGWNSRLTFKLIPAS